jgi:DNA-binding transcriptional ArsR family regulator
MPYRQFVAQELATLLGAVSHHDRIQIVQELAKGEQEVKLLQQKLEISHSRVSQHLSLLRSHKIVSERRVGRRVLYHLVVPELAQWLLDALQFIEFRLQRSDELLSAVETARHLWQMDADSPEAASLLNQATQDEPIRRRA